MYEEGVPTGIPIGIPVAGTQPPSQPLTPEALEKYAAIVREMIRHEDEVLDQRITWLCQIQGLLFAALAFVWGEPTAYYLILVFCVVGFVVALTTWSALRQAWRGVIDLLMWWIKNSANYSGPTVYARKRYTGRLKHLTPWNIIPMSFSVAWLLVFIITWAVFT